MSAAGVDPDEASWRSALYAWERAESSAECGRRAEALLDRMTASKVVPSAASWNIVIKTWANNVIKGDFDSLGQMERLLERMVGMGQSPDLFTFNTIARAYARRGDEIGLFALLRQFPLFSKHADRFTIHPFLVAVANINSPDQQLSRLREVLGFMRQHGHIIFDDHMLELASKIPTFSLIDPVELSPLVRPPSQT